MVHLFVLELYRNRGRPWHEKKCPMLGCSPMAYKMGSMEKEFLNGWFQCLHGMILWVTEFTGIGSLSFGEEVGRISWL